MLCLLDQPSELSCKTTSIHPIRDEGGLIKTTEQIRGLWGSDTETPKGELLDFLMDMVELYESKHHSIGLPDPIEAIRIRMEDLDLKPIDLAKELGTSRGYISDILNQKRQLTLPIIQKLSETLGLSRNLLTQPY